jgi:hypothetical protein
MAPPRYRGIGGANLRMFWNGLDAGYMTGFRYNKAANTLAVGTCGDAYMDHFVPNTIRVTCGADFIFIQQRSLEEMGLVLDGDTEDIVEAEPGVIELRTLRDRVIYKVEGVMPESVGFSIGRETIATQNITFNARRVYDYRRA